MDLNELKPLLTALLLPPASPLLLIVFGAALSWPTGTRRAVAWTGALSTLIGAGLLWLLSCHGTAVWLSRHALPPVQALAPDPSSQLNAAGVQAIVVLGGGVQAQAREYGQPQPSAATAARLRYGLHLARHSGLPLAFAGGVGWSSAGMHNQAPEAQAAQAMVTQAGLRLQWLDDRSRDTAENASRMRELMQPQGVRRIALVTHAGHMPRSLRHFERGGFEVLPAPMGFVEPRESPWLQWLPSGEGLAASRSLLREWLGLRLS